MWQRIQTVWLVAVVILMALFVSQPLTLFTLGDQTHLLGAWGITDLSRMKTFYSAWPIGVLGTLCAFIALVSIFLYKDSTGRTFQIRLGTLNILLMVGLLLYITFVVWSYSSATSAEIGIKAWLALPFVSIILQLLAVRAVLRDETLVRMSNRLR
ncbi:MAG: DUF4293 domain-containing protein [Porphyromonadaceae bacterium]|nr:DUF4293 domain-containing protein [Porphyromonadaceae bacterium]